MYLNYSEEDKRYKLSIIQMDKVLQEFVDGDFLDCFVSLLAYYYVYNIPFHKKIEKILGFFLEAIEFPEQMHFENTRSVTYLKTLKSLKLVSTD